MADLAMPAGTPAIPPERACRLHGDRCTGDVNEAHIFAPAATPADKGLAARQLAEHTRQHLTAATTAGQAALDAHRHIVIELAERALADADRIDWHAPDIQVTVAGHFGAMKRHVRQLLRIIHDEENQR